MRLIHGERIPLVEEVLDAAYYRTPIRLVYLDNKASANLAMEQNLQKKYIDLSAGPGGRKDFQVLLGIPSDDKQNEFLALPDYANTPSLNELSMDDARKTKSHIWVPRFTLGPQPGNVAQWNAESPGNRVFTWTMDVPTYIEQYMAQSDFDGMVTNYAPMVAYYHYTRQ